MKDLLFDKQRTAALAITCPYCHAEIGGQCVNRKTGVPIENQAAHWLRLVAASSSTTPST